jgi:protein-tyrosine-phosphatase
MNVLFVCRGNVGRSQMAEVIFNLLSEGKNIAFSAGTKVNENEGQKLKEKVPAANVLRVLNELGVNAEDNVRTQLTLEILNKADVIISMAEPETIPDYLKDNIKVIYWDIIDPFEKSLEETRDIRDQINSLVKDLIDNIGLE